MINAEQVAMSLKKPRRTGSGWMACCPAHEDDDPSLSITDGDGKVLVHCHAGCSQDEVLAALVTGGIHLNGDARLDGPLNFHAEHGQASAFWDYYDKTGTRVGRVMRFDNGSGKTFRQASLHGGSWIWKAMPSPRPLYRLREAMRRPADTVLVCEGEKAADAARRFLPGAVVVSWPGGAKAVAKADWTPLAGRSVILWPDADAPGREAMGKLAGILRAQDCELELVDLTAFGELPTGWDAADATLEQQEKVRSMPLAKGPELTAPGIVLRPLAEIVAERREPDWLIHRVLERGVLAVLAGPRSTFKSFIGLHWCMKVGDTGKPVVILSGEGAGLDRRADAWMRVHGSGRDLAKMPIRVFERPLNLNLANELAALRDAIGDTAPALILVDTLSKFSAGLDENSNFEIAAYLARISAELRQVYGCTVLLVTHSGHGDAKRPRGASALMANPDAEYIVTRPDPTAMTVTVSRERFKDSPSMPPLAYNAQVIDLDRVDGYGDAITSLAMVPTDVSASVTKQIVPRGRAQRQLLAALRARQAEAKNDDPLIWTVSDLRDVGRHAGMHRNTARCASEALALSPFMVPTVGGYRLSGE